MVLVIWLGVKGYLVNHASLTFPQTKTNTPASGSRLLLGSTRPNDQLGPPALWTARSFVELRRPIMRAFSDLLSAPDRTTAMDDSR